ncbi:MAG: YidC/Oxa1 family membrane protein insertase [Candidatus Sericytochromatia bacterium]
MNPIDFLVHQMMLPILEKSYALTGNYGWAIIFLTVIIRMLLLPLTMQSFYSTKEMQKLQPKLKKIQERYKNKPEELNKHMVALYRDHKVNPLGGCLPMLIQMPFLFALYGSLIGDDFKKLLASSGDKSFLILPDLTHLGLYDKGVFHIENIILLALFTLTTVLQQRIMVPPPTPDSDPRQVAIQKQMQVMMPIMITSMFIMIPLPTGIFLYLVVSNLIGIGQYTYLNWHSKRRDALAATTGATSSAMNSKDVDEDEEPPASSSLAWASPEGTPPVADGPARYQVKKGAKKKKKRK